MRLTTRETERLLLFTAAELARRRQRDGIPLGHPDCVALACDVALEAARAGGTYAEVEGSVRGLLGREELLPGVAEMLDEPVQVEATFGDGSRLVSLRELVRG
jgi:urease subunit gamma